MRISSEKAIKELQNQLRNRFPDFRGLYLYGSEVNGVPDHDSDIDVVSIFDNRDANFPDREKENEIYEIAGQIEAKYSGDVSKEHEAFVFFDLRIYTMDRLRQNPVYFDRVVAKGVYYAGNP